MLAMCVLSISPMNFTLLRKLCLLVLSLWQSTQTTLWTYHLGISLQGSVAEQKTSGNALALPLTDALPADGTEKKVAAAACNGEKVNDLTQPREHEAWAKTLETFEQEAFAALEKKKGKCFKRPAAAPKASTKASAKAKAKGKVAGHLKFGCKTCRGTVKGCRQRRNPNYPGHRMNRQEWIELAKKHGWK